ncbi:thioredoxin domain-containing protein [Candidatus Saccharibacteria bacterium]|nr:thioredoxin domain-containing protein [Candidatus Saccharibacteria bacterium]
MNKTVRICLLVGIFGLIFLALITSSVKHPDISEKIWNKEMTLGDTENASRHFIIYTDLMCPYCNYYAHTVAENDDKLNDYISEHKIAYEVRVTDMLYEGSGIEYSRPAAEGAYCAAREGKFWDYYHLALDSLFSDYYSKGIGNSKTAPMISDMTRDYWKKIGEKAGLGDSFKSCYDNRETVQEIQENTLKASAVASGLPFFVFGKYSTGGFDNSWGWEEIVQMYNAGLN